MSLAYHARVPDPPDKASGIREEGRSCPKKPDVANGEVGQTVLSPTAGV